MLEALENPATGGPRGAACVDSRRGVPGSVPGEPAGPHRHWNDEAPLSGVVSSHRLDRGVSPDPRPGTHSTAGFALAVGPAVRPHARVGRISRISRRACWRCSASTRRLSTVGRWAS